MTIKRPSRPGFTIVELIITMSIVAILVTIVVTAYNGIQARARDTARISDLQGISEAIKTYRVKYGNDIQTGSGCGGFGNGNGYFNYVGGGYPATILSCLTTVGYLDASFIDPSGCVSSAGACGTKGIYMKYSCGTGDAAITYLYARLETSGDTADLIAANICSSSTVATNYGMNYMLIVD